MAHPDDLARVHDGVRDLATTFAAQRAERHVRTTLDRADFDALAEAGFTLLPVPRDHGGLWTSHPESIRHVAGVLRTLAQGDPSVALVSSMHPGVVFYWHSSPEAPPEHAAAWREQLELISRSAVERHWWGTITSEPGSGGDIARTRAVASLDSADGGYRLSGQKHFGSGSGITSFMMTTAVPEDEDAGEPDIFFLDVRDAKWDGSNGVTMTAPWDGHGMIATQSHGFAFDGYPATRAAWPGNLANLGTAAGGAVVCLFAAVVMGIVDSAMAEARPGMERRRDSLNAYERVEWTRAELEAWLAEQAFEGMLRAVEREGGTPVDVLQGKAAIAELSESLLGRLCRVIGGGTFNRASPFGHWFEDVRALGFLRPPWGLMFGNLIDAALPAEE